jgi:hypothetical protein
MGGAVISISELSDYHGLRLEQEFELEGYSKEHEEQDADPDRRCALHRSTNL